MKGWLLVCWQVYLGVAFINWVCDGLHKVMPHAAVWVSISQVCVSVIAGLVAAAGRMDQAQEGAAHQNQQKTRGGAPRDGRFHDRATLRLLILTGCPTCNVVAFLPPPYRVCSVTRLHKRRLSLTLLCSCQLTVGSNSASFRQQEGFLGRLLHPPLP